MSGCSNREIEDVSSCLDKLPSSFRYHLVNSDDSTFARYCRMVGCKVIMDNINIINHCLLDLPPEEYWDQYQEVRRYSVKMAGILESEYHYGKPMKAIKEKLALPYETRQKINAIKDCLDSLYWEKGLTVGQRIEGFLDVMPRLERYGDRDMMGVCQMNLAEQYRKKGDYNNFLRFINRAMKTMESYGNYKMLCQALGRLGIYYENTGRADSMIICYERARRLANGCRFPVQAARISSFYGGYYSRQGRFSLAQDMFQRAIEQCRQYGGGYREIRFLLHAVNFYSDLGCWDIVERLLDRVHILERRYRDHQIQDLFRIRISQVEGRLMMARGDLSRSNAIFEEIKNETSQLSYRGEHAQLLFYWAEGLCQSGCPEKALSLIEEGGSYCSEKMISDWEARLFLLEAEAEFSLGNYDKTKQALEFFEQPGWENRKKLARCWVKHDALLGLLNLGRGNETAARKYLVQGLGRLADYVAETDGSVHSYLWVERCEELRNLLHDVTGSDPRLGYGAEMLWRYFYRGLGSGINGLSGNRLDCFATDNGGDWNAALKQIMHIAAEAECLVNSKNAVHIVYLIKEDRIWRWTAGRGGIRRDVLEGSVDRIKALVAEAIGQMSSDPCRDDTGIDQSLADRLSILARLLLPEEFVNPSGKRDSGLTYITTNGFLGQVPFETLNVGTGGEYRPLIMDRDIAYLRYMEPSLERENCGPGMIVVSPEVSDALQKRYAYPRRLKEAYNEGAAVAGVDPAAVFLKGRWATKENLLKGWEKASYIYMAVHTLRNPKVPYLMLIPLAAPSDTTEHEKLYLDTADIRASDLSRSELVILSSCASGAPYCEDTDAGPSLGDAFLDAGSGAVVQTFWDVRDSDATEFMKSFVRDWKREGRDPVHSLCEEKRELIRREGVDSHPFRWAAYSIKLGRLK